MCICLKVKDLFSWTLKIYIGFTVTVYRSWIMSNRCQAGNLLQVYLWAFFPLLVEKCNLDKDATKQ